MARTNNKSRNRAVLSPGQAPKRKNRRRKNKKPGDIMVRPRTKQKAPSVIFYACQLHEISQIFQQIFAVGRFQSVFREMELFLSVCESLNVDSQTSSEWLDTIKREYSRETRHFHNLQMLEHKFGLIEEFAMDEPFKSALVLATLFQYFHYDTKRDLKSENCEEFKRFIEQTAIKDQSLITDVLAMLQDESIPPSEASYQIDLFNDLDLAVLGSSPEDYATYAQSLQKEYDCNDSYRRDRLKMLKTLLMIPSIYSSELLRERFEASARRNIQNEIDYSQN